MPVDTVVFDVLGTLVDQEGGLREALAGRVPDVADAVARWQRYIAGEHRRVVAGERPYVPADVLDREAAEHVVGERADDLADVTARLDAWPDTAEILERLAATHEVVALSNADHATLLRLDAHAGLRWHAALSTEAVRSYKPDPAVYRLAIERVARPPARILMVAAHAWDLRGAQAAGMRTAFLDRPGADAPTAQDRFDHHVTSAGELLAATA
ncbi:2-haloacid dehalogenase [Actinomycetospora succinea]|uniref:2-haloacid dehalogenase n=1 Tax=Actinomycetospora succinea TaxID=663603 RepID=A0A4R6V1Y7_9PSEU|nr:haloacid dehalogenase type II [Actinomycetospora succinea]TDQ53913.1 2-haloacid dehalogenase [Actinomycetospora succinea]